MTVEAIVGQIELAADEPLCKWLFPLQHLFEWLEPNQLVFGLFAPKLFRGTDRFVVKFPVFRQRFESTAFRKLLRRVENAGFLENGSDTRGFVVYSHTISALLAAFYEEEAKRQRSKGGNCGVA